MKKIISGVLLFVILYVAGLAAIPHKPSPLPVVVAEQSFVNQIGPIPETTLFTPNSDATFRVSCYLDTATQPSTGNDSVVLSWSDDFNPQVQGFPELQGGSGGVAFSQGFIVVRAKAGMPIAVNGQGTTAGNTYNVYLTVEQL